MVDPWEWCASGCESGTTLFSFNRDPKKWMSPSKVEFEATVRKVEETKLIFTPVSAASGYRVQERRLR